MIRCYQSWYNHSELDHIHVQYSDSPHSVPKGPLVTSVRVQVVADGPKSEVLKSVDFIPDAVVDTTSAHEHSSLLENMHSHGEAKARTIALTPFHQHHCHCSHTISPTPFHPHYFSNTISATCTSLHPHHYIHTIASTHAWR